jgi:hypothetical protein
MGLLGIVFIIVLIILFFLFPKQMLSIGLVLIVLIIILWWIFIEMPQKRRDALNKKVIVSVAYDPNICSLKTPLLVNIRNNSSKTITKVWWNVDIFVAGYSTNISGFDNSYSSDKILKPGEGWTSCYQLPSSLKVGNQPLNSLRYTISNQWVNSED